jgi:adenylate kinase family enzyme
MKRVVILGRGAAGKSTLARQLGEMTGLPTTELDKLFWQSGLAPTQRAEWTAFQQQLARKDSWILDGDLGPHDVVEVRLRAADTVILLDFGLVRCTWRALRRARERAAFWLWVLTYRRDSVPHLRAMIARHSPNATVHILRSPTAVKQFLSDMARQFGTTGGGPRRP